VHFDTPSLDSVSVVKRTGRGKRFSTTAANGFETQFNVNDVKRLICLAPISNDDFVNRAGVL
jgi:hypothetical protein